MRRLCLQSIQNQNSTASPGVWPETTPLKIHTLSRLAEITEIDQEMTEDQLDFIDFLEPLNIEARYPTYKERLLKSLNNDICIELINKTDQLRSWIKTKL